MKSPDAYSDYKLEQWIGNLLRAGVFVAAAVVLIGGVMFLTQHRSDHPDYRSFHPETNAFRSVTGVVKDAFALDSRGIIQLGLLLLIFTPIARVIASAVGFTVERDYLYVALTLVVLGVLLYSLLMLR